MQRSMNEHIRRLREQNENTPPRLYLERADLETDVYLKYEGTVSVPELRILTPKHVMGSKTLYINDRELIVGERGDGPQSASIPPGLCYHTMEDMQVINDREPISFKVPQTDLKPRKEKIISYWQNRSIRHKILESVVLKRKECYEDGIFTELMEQRDPGHTVGSENIFPKDSLERKVDIQQAIETLDFIRDREAPQKKEQLSVMPICCDAIMILGRWYVDYARELAVKELSETRRAELLQIAINCDVVPASRPQTYWQVIQMYWFVHLCVATELDLWDSYSPGHLDQYLNPFYQKDASEGILDDKKARGLLECLWTKFSNQPVPLKVGIILKESGTHADFASINTEGITPDGEDGINSISYLISDCMDEMRLFQPSSNVQISRRTPQKFLKRVCEISQQGWGQPVFYNTEEITQELLNASKTIEDVRKGGTSGCMETGVFGNEAYTLTGYLNLPKTLELTLNNRYDPVVKKQLGLKLGYAADFHSFEELLKAHKKQIHYFMDIKIEGLNIIESIYAKYASASFSPIVTNDRIQKGKDYNAGGARYNISYLQGMGIGTITDFLSTIKSYVYDKKDLDMPRLMEVLHANFEGYEDVRHPLLNEGPKYGDDDDYADHIMRGVFRYYRTCVTGRPNMRGGQYRVNMLPTTCHVYFGEAMEASPDGCLAHKPVSEGISPIQGSDTNGSIVVIRSVVKMDHISTGGTLLNQKLTPSSVPGEKGLSHMADLIRAYLNLDGHHIQSSVINRKVLLEAQKHPEEYKDLIVHMVGYSDHFRNFSRALQDGIIDRTEQAT